MGTTVEVSKSSSRALNLKIPRASIVANGGLREDPAIVYPSNPTSGSSVPEVYPFVLRSRNNAGIFRSQSCCTTSVLEFETFDGCYKVSVEPFKSVDASLSASDRSESDKCKILVFCFVKLTDAIEHALTTINNYPTTSNHDYSELTIRKLKQT
uniref:Uncharacterized protein n=1 Tax=Vespula pensylvanica TaxID=30213 RepID=A0A834UCT8_VESPE|nr:hypothetical protein H0235_004266 [Vespula pensylvanica]